MLSVVENGLDPRATIPVSRQGRWVGAAEGTGLPLPRKSHQGKKRESKLEEILPSPDGLICSKIAVYLIKHGEGLKCATWRPRISIQTFSPLFLGHVWSKH